MIEAADMDYTLHQKKNDDNNWCYVRMGAWLCVSIGELVGGVAGIVSLNTTIDHRYNW